MESKMKRQSKIILISIITPVLAKHVIVRILYLCDFRVMVTVNNCNSFCKCLHNYYYGIGAILSIKLYLLLWFFVQVIDTTVHYS